MSTLAQQILLQLDKERIRFENASSNYEKLNIGFNIVQLKIDSNDESIKKDLFLEIRNLINYSVGSIDESYHGYYSLTVDNTKKILSKISYLALQEQIALLEYFMRKLKLAGYYIEAEKLEKELNYRELKLLISPFKLKEINKLIIAFTTLNIFTLCLSLILIYIIYSVLLLPAPIDWMELFHIDYNQYSSNVFLNHFANTILDFCQIESDFKVMPMNLFGVCAIVFIKITIFVLIFNYFLSEIKRKLKF